MMRRQHVHFLFAVLGLLETDHKRYIGRLLDQKVIDRALRDMFQRELFPEWFQEEFSYDPLYVIMSGLRECFSQAAADLLIRLDGSDFKYHLELSEDEALRLTDDIPIERSTAQALAKELDILIREYESLRT